MENENQTEEVKKAECSKNVNNEEVVVDEKLSEEKVEEKTEEKTEEKVELKKVEEIDYKSKFFYLAAEFENTKKRFERERENIVKYGSERLLSSLLDVVDNLDRSLAAIKLDQDEKVKNICVGIDMVRNQFIEVLKKNGLTQIESIGKTFDPNFHEAMCEKEVEGKNVSEIIEEFQKGYILNGRLLRASKVIIAKAPATSTEDLSTNK